MAETLIVDSKHLEAAILFAAKKDKRHYLQGVWIGPGPRGDTLLATTDGHAGVVIRAATEYPGAWPAAGFVLKAESVALAIKAAGKDAYIELAPDRAGPITGAGIDEKYPDILRIIPRETSGEVAQFDPALLVKFSKARRVLTGKNDGFIVVGHNGGSAARVEVGTPEFVGVIMPLRMRDAEAVTFDMPEWLQPADVAAAA